MWRGVGRGMHQVMRNENCVEEWGCGQGVNRGRHQVVRNENGVKRNGRGWGGGSGVGIR